MNKKLYIMRGVPGSGKSTKAKMLAPKENIFSTDEFWGPDYNFDITKIGEAHKWNQKRVYEAMQKGITPIVVDNTNITKRDYKAYIDMSFIFMYEVEYAESEHPLWKITSMNLLDKEVHKEDLDQAAKFFTTNTIHGVPEAVIRNMLNKWEVI
jgi:NEDD4-binding protein 2